MKKDTFKKVVAGVMMTTTMGLAACTESSVTVKDFEVTRPTEAFQVDDTFSLSGFKLKLKTCKI